MLSSVGLSGSMGYTTDGKFISRSIRAEKALMNYVNLDQAQHKGFAVKLNMFSLLFGRRFELEQFALRPLVGGLVGYGITKSERTPLGGTFGTLERIRYEESTFWGVRMSLEGLFPLTNRLSLKGKISGTYYKFKWAEESFWMKYSSDEDYLVSIHCGISFTL